MKMNEWKRTDDGSVANAMTLQFKEAILDLYVIDWHSFDEMGNTLETVTVHERMGEPNVKWEMFSQNEGETFTMDIEE
tara:strand:- start:263 stop:496 length:234 start_codon:yes stop_codon:yes gene_type:complete